MIIETIDQINKDLQNIYPDIPYPSPDLSDFHEYILRFLIEMLQQIPPKMVQSFLYRVDIPEATLLKLMRNKLPKRDFNMQLGKLIIEREFKKVYLRRLFSKNKP